MISIDVKGSGESHWTEQWTPVQLAYFILMADLPQPKFISAQSLEWIPFDTNHYKWRRSELSEEEFENLRKQFPSSAPRAFVRRDCEQVVLLLAPGWTWGMTLDPPSDRPLMDALIELCEGEMVYEGFNHAVTRHLFRSILDDGKAVKLRNAGRQLRKLIASTSSELAKEIQSGRVVGRPVLFGCKEPGFTCPVTIWHET